MAGAMSQSGLPDQTAPPPLPGASMYWLAIEGQQTGPFSFELLMQKAQAGQLNADTLVWTQGMPSWAAASTIPALTAIFGAAPPPLPPQP